MYVKEQVIEIIQCHKEHMATAVEPPQQNYILYIHSIQIVYTLYSTHWTYHTHTHTHTHTQLCAIIVSNIYSTFFKCHGRKLRVNSYSNLEASDIKLRYFLGNKLHNNNNYYNSHVYIYIYTSWLSVYTYTCIAHNVLFVDSV